MDVFFIAKIRLRKANWLISFNCLDLEKTNSEYFHEIKQTFC